MHDDRVIHLSDYRRATEATPRAGLSLAAATGADWAGLVRWSPDGPEALTVVDLGTGDTRMAPAEGLSGRAAAGPPDIRMTGTRLTLALGRFAGDPWGVVLGGVAVAPASVRDELLFLAGECAGLLALENGGIAGDPDDPGVSRSDPSDA
jgi:hypothetical protein